MFISHTVNRQYRSGVSRHVTSYVNLKSCYTSQVNQKQQIVKGHLFDSMDEMMRDEMGIRTRSIPSNGLLCFSKTHSIARLRGART
jgi:hypothetical protein